jgi:hypothetical protein
MIDKLLRAQADFKPLRKTKENPYFHSSYAGLDDVMDSISDSLRKHGLVITSQSVPHEKGLLLTTSIHDIESKQSIQSSFFIAELDPQKIGSGMTYARRYNIVNLLNLVADEDDDGNQASKPTQKPWIDPEKPKFDQSGSDQNHMLLPGDVIPKWWWDLKKTDWKEAGKFMPKGYGAKKVDGKYIVAERDQTPIKYDEDTF